MISLYQVYITSAVVNVALKMGVLPVRTKIGMLILRAFVDPATPLQSKLTPQWKSGFSTVREGF
jgi:hypothetical protein